MFEKVEILKVVPINKNTKYDLLFCTKIKFASLTLHSFRSIGNQTDKEDIINGYE
jgi:hypothetical protein